MTKEFPMTNTKKIKQMAEIVLPFELRHYLVIRVSSLVISLFRSLENIEESQIAL
jgi:hypothetical protein